MLRSLSAAALVAILGSSAAWAQVRVPKPITTPDGQAVVRGRQQSEAPPSAVPGARAEPALVAPAERIPSDMPPTEALFDSINRGDVVAAREAIGRGADIHGRNVLGLTPLEEAVDLGRNDISFLLLSLRGGAGYGTAAAPRGTVADKLSPGETRAARRAEAQAAARESARARREQLAEARATRPETRAVPARNARLFAGDGGTPVPQAGFLGFDSAR